MSALKDCVDTKGLSIDESDDESDDESRDDIDESTCSEFNLEEHVKDLNEKQELYALLVAGEEFIIAVGNEHEYPKYKKKLRRFQIRYTVPFIELAMNKDFIIEYYPQALPWKAITDKIRFVISQTPWSLQCYIQIFVMHVFKQ